MGSLYCQLTFEDRVRIEVLLGHGARQSGVARYLGCHRSTVSREVSRATASGFRTYAAEFGQRHKIRCRRQAGRSRRKLSTDLDSPAWQHVREGLAAKRSPQEIAGRLALMCRAAGVDHLSHEAYVSHETVYCAIYALPRGQLREQLISQLTRSRAGRRPRSRAAKAPTIADMTPIALRPPEVAARIVPGHWEGDLIKGAGNRSAVGTLVERTSRYIMLVKLDGLGSQAVIDAFNRRLREVPPSLRKTLTYDQGSEMALHKELARKLRIDIYFCDAHSPWQRGTNESANGIVREFLPKGIDLSQFTEEDLRNVEFIMNNTPRKILGYYTPAEVFSRLKIDDIAGVALQT
jgi:IS30 family transposase